MKKGFVGSKLESIFWFTKGYPSFSKGLSYKKGHEEGLLHHFFQVGFCSCFGWKCHFKNLS